MLIFGGEDLAAAPDCEAFLTACAAPGCGVLLTLTFQIDFRIAFGFVLSLFPWRLHDALFLASPRGILCVLGATNGVAATICNVTVVFVGFAEAQRSIWVVSVSLKGSSAIRSRTTSIRVLPREP